jgi:hypothetical protein
MVNLHVDQASRRPRRRPGATGTVGRGRQGRSGEVRNTGPAHSQSCIKGEAESAYLINFYYEASPNWAVIHDLRLERNGRTAQIDHLLINRWLECYVLESKHFHAGIKITEEGEFMRWNDYKHTYEGMPSPLLQNERHITVLRDVVNTLTAPAQPPRRQP